VLEKLSIAIIILSLSCGSILQVKNGTEAYNYKKYAVAIDMLQTELSEENDLQKRLLLARSFDEIGDYEGALQHYNKFVGASDNVNVMLEYGRVLKKAHKYDQAAEVFKMLKTEAMLDPVLDREIASSLRSMEWINQPDTLIQIRPIDINTEFSEYAPSWIDGHLVFTSDRVTDPKEKIYDWTGNSFSNLWQSGAFGGDIIAWSSVINSELNEGSAVLHPNGKDVYFTRCTDRGDADVFCHIFKASRDDYGGWKEVVPIDNVNGLFNSRHPTFSKDGNIMFYSSDQNSSRGYDIHYSSFAEGVWQTGLALPEMINSEMDEVFPYLYGDTLYFASNGRVGMGGLDLYQSYFGKNDQWVRPINLGYPINSGADDFGLFFDTLHRSQGIKKAGYLSSNRIGGKGKDDIYFFQFLEAAEKDNEARDKPWTLTVKVLEPVYRVKGNPNSGIRKYSPVEGASLTLSDTNLLTNVTGVYSSQVDSTAIVSILAQKEGYLTESKEINVFRDAEDHMVYARLILQPIFYGQEINLDQIYYDFDRWEIREDAKPSLDSLIQVLNDNPSIKIRLASHTDCRGDDDFNLDLSQKRAESAVNYIVNKGINPQRLSAKGRGESEPSVFCECDDCTEEDHQKNRRTTFEILKN